MNCAEFEDRLQDLLDRRLVPEDDAALREHAERCDPCADSLHAQRRLFAGLRGIAATPAEVDFSQQVIMAVAVERPSANSRSRWMWIPAIAVSLLAFFAWSQRDRETTGVKKGPIETARPGETVVPTPASSPLHAVAAIDRERELREYRRLINDVAVRINEGPEVQGMNQTISPSIRPIRSSFGLAIDALRRTLPRGKELRREKPVQGAGWTHSSLEYA